MKISDCGPSLMTHHTEVVEVPPAADHVPPTGKSTLLLALSILLAPGLWATDATSMSLFWMTKLPVDRAARRTGVELKDMPQDAKRSHAALAHSPGRIRRWKVALSLAVVAAVAAPFAAKSYKAHPTYDVWVPLTPNEMQELASLPPAKPSSSVDPDLAGVIGDCLISENTGNLICKNELKDGGYRGEQLDKLKYIGINAIVSILAFATTFLGLMLLIEIIRATTFVARRYWSWLRA